MGKRSDQNKQMEHEIQLFCLRRAEKIEEKNYIMLFGRPGIAAAENHYFRSENFFLSLTPQKHEKFPHMHTKHT